LGKCFASERQLVTYNDGGVLKSGNNFVWTGFIEFDPFVFEVWLAKPDGKGVSLKEDDRMALGVDGHVSSSVSLHENGDNSRI